MQAMADAAGQSTLFPSLRRFRHDCRGFPPLKLRRPLVGRSAFPTRHAATGDWMAFLHIPATSFSGTDERADVPRSPASPAFAHRLTPAVRGEIAGGRR
jgi:hypothetical protein